MSLRTAVSVCAATYAGPEYMIESWDTDQGLPESSATAMVQTPDGYLWFGTFNGLVRFDGVKFTVFDHHTTPSLPSQGIVNLHLDASRRLWVSTYRGLVVSEPGQWTSFHRVSAWTGNFVRTFTENAGVLCATSFDGKVLRAQGDRFEELPDPPGLRGEGYRGYVDPGGRVWVAQTPAFFGFWDGSQWRSSTLASNVVLGEGWLLGSRNGDLLVVKRREVLRLRGDSLISRLPLPEVEPGMFDIWSAFEDKQGSIWVSARGLFRIRPSGSLQGFSTTNGLTSDSLRFTFEDREGNIWVGSSGGGLMRFKPRTFFTFGKQEGLSEPNVKAVAEATPGVILAGTYGSGLFRVQDGHVVRPEPPWQPASKFVQCLLVDRGKNIWVGTYGPGVEGGGLAKIGPNGRMAVPGLDAVGRNVRALFEDSLGRIWIGGEQAVWVLADGRLSQAEPPQGMFLGDVRCFAEHAEQKVIWAATGTGLFRFAGGQWREIRPDSGRPLLDILCLRTEPDGTLWLGDEEKGLTRFRQGKWASIGQAHGLPSSRVHSIVVDDLGYWWLGSNHGLARAAGAELARVADAAAAGLPAVLACSVFNAGDGLASVSIAPGFQSPALKDRQGKLWFATLRGVAMADPSRLILNTNQPPVVIERVTFRDKLGVMHDLPWTGGSSVTAPPGSRELEVHYAGLNFIAPEKMRFAYTLTGQGEDWIDAGTRRSIWFYTPPPGTIQFKVKAANNDGLWNETGASVALVVQPFFWQTLWFRGFAVLTFGGAVALSVGRTQRNKLRWAEERLRQQQAIAEERARSAALTQYASDAIVLMDPRGRIIYESPSTSRVLGYESGFLMGKDPIEFVHPEDQATARHAMRILIEGAGTGKSTTFRMRHAAGHWVPLESVGTNLLDHAGVNGIMVTARDITERNRASAALRRSEERYRAFIANSTEGIWRYEGKEPVPTSLPREEQLRRFLEQGVLAECNDAMARMYGYERAEDLVGLRLADLARSDPRNAENLLKFIDSGYRLVDAETFERDRDGNLRHFQNSFVGVVEDGCLVRVWGVQRDITVRKRAEADLRRNEAMLSEVIHSVPQSIFWKDRRFVYAGCNEVFARAVGLDDPRKIVGKTDFDLPWPRAEAEGYIADDRAVMESGQPKKHIIEPLQQADGSRLWVDTTKVPLFDADGQVCGVLGVYEDITERKRAEETLSRHRAFREVLTGLLGQFSSDDGTGLNELLGRALLEVGQFVGAERAVLLQVASDGASWRITHEWRADRCETPADQRPDVPIGTYLWSEEKLHAGKPVVISSLSEMPPEASAERQAWSKQGFRSVLYVPLRGKGGEFRGCLGLNSLSRELTWATEDVRYLGIVADVIASAVERMHAELALRESEARYRSLFETMSQGFVLGEIICDGQGKPVDWRHLEANHAMELLSGIRTADRLAKTALELAPDMDPYWIATLGEVALSGVPLRAERFGNITRKHLEVVAFSPAKGRFAALYTDLTERKLAEKESRHLQEQLIQAQKMEGIGQLAGGVAHDFNNILTTILMQVSMLQEERDLRPDILAGLAELETEAKRAAGLTRQLLMFSRRQVMFRKTFDLNSLLGNLLRMLRRLIGEHIGLEFMGAPAALWVVADPGMLEQLVMNLVVNARDAMPSGGRVTLTTRPLELAHDAPMPHPDARPGSFVSLAVSDTGCGIDESILEHIFEPFFTTKEPGKGTGLGLATVFGIVKQHEGWIEVETAKGKGCTFTVFLPASAKLSTVTVDEAKISSMPRGRETLMVVEDEAPVRCGLETLLRRLGYEVVSAANAPEALLLWEKLRGSVDLVMSDIVMPGGMSGIELSERLLRMKPTLRVILMSGYSVDTVHGGLPQNDRLQFLQKPFDASGLALMLRDCLDRDSRK